MQKLRSTVCTRARRESRTLNIEPVYRTQPRSALRFSRSTICLAAPLSPPGRLRNQPNDKARHIFTLLKQGLSALLVTLT